MGIELVKIIATRLGNLSGNAYKVLIYMATVALDRPNDKGQPARLYFAGWEPLALALGYEGQSPYAKTAVKRAVKELVKAGLISPQVRGVRTGTSQCYRLELTPQAIANWGPQNDPQQPRGDVEARGSESDPLPGSKSDPQQGVTSSPTGGPNPTPLGRTQEEPEDLEQDSTPIRPASTPDRAHEAGEMHANHGDWAQSHAFDPDDHGHFCAHCSLPASHQRHDVARWSA